MAKKKPPPLPYAKPKTKRTPKTQSMLSAQARAAIARTKKARAELDAQLEGVDISDLAHLPVMVMQGPPKSVSHKKKEMHEDDEQSEESEEMAIEAPVRKARRAAPKKAKQKPEPLAEAVGASP